MIGLQTPLMTRGCQCSSAQFAWTGGEKTQNEGCRGHLLTLQRQGPPTSVQSKLLHRSCGDAARSSRRTSSGLSAASCRLLKTGALSASSGGCGSLPELGCGVALSGGLSTSAAVEAKGPLPPPFLAAASAWLLAEVPAFQEMTAAVEYGSFAAAQSEHSRPLRILTDPAHSQIAPASVPSEFLSYAAFWSSKVLTVS